MEIGRLCLAFYLLFVGVVSPDPEGVGTPHPLSRPRDHTFSGSLTCPTSSSPNINICMYLCVKI